MEVNLVATFELTPISGASDGYELRTLLEEGGRSIFSKFALFSFIDFKMKNAIYWCKLEAYPLDNKRVFLIFGAATYICLMQNRGRSGSASLLQQVRSWRHFWDMSLCQCMFGAQPEETFALFMKY